MAMNVKIGSIEPWLHLETMHSLITLRRNLLGTAFLSALSIPCAFAFTPTVEITEPSGIHYVAGFPASVNVTLSLSVFNTSNNNCITNGIKSITVNAQHGDDPATTIHTSSSDPINNST